MKTKLSGVAALLSVVALFVSACGGSSSGTDTSPITVGELFPITGRESFIGTWFTHATQVAVAEVNNNGGVMGRKLQTVLADTGGDPVDAVTALKKLQTNNPTFIVGPSSLEIQGVVSQFDPAQLPDFVEGGTTQLDHMTNRYVYRTTPSDSTLAIGMAYYALNTLNCKTAGYFFENTANAAGIVNPLVASYKAHGGAIASGADVEASPHQSSYSTEVEKLFANNPQCVFIQTDAQTASTFFNAVRQLGHLNVPFIGSDVSADISYAQAMGVADAEQWLTGMNGAPPSGPAYQHFLQVYQQVLNSSHPDTLSQNMYDSIIIASLAMTKAGSTDPKKWIDVVKDVAANPAGEKVYTYADGVAAIKAGKAINYEGASGSCDYNQYHNVAGSWDVVKLDTDGKTYKTVLTVPEQTIAEWTPAQ